jgi:hypothetical protein
MKIQIIIIDDDPEMESRPLYEELVEKYSKENVIWKENPDDGLSYIKNNLTRKTIIILDYDFGSKENGLKLFQKIQGESALIYIILNTAKSIDEIPNDELKAFINNHLMALVDKADGGYEKTLFEVDKAISYLNNRVDCILEEWILRHEFFTREKPYIKDEKGNNISLNDVLNEIRKDTEFGRKMSRNIISTAISLLQRDIDKIDKQ